MTKIPMLIVNSLNHCNIKTLKLKIIFFLSIFRILYKLFAYLQQNRLSILKKIYIKVFSFWNQAQLYNSCAVNFKYTVIGSPINFKYTLQSLIDFPLAYLFLEKFPPRIFLFHTAHLLNLRKCSSQDIFKSRQ